MKSNIAENAEKNYDTKTKGTYTVQKTTYFQQITQKINTILRKEFNEKDSQITPIEYLDKNKLNGYYKSFQETGESAIRAGKLAAVYISKSSPLSNTISLASASQMVNDLLPTQ